MATKEKKQKVGILGTIERVGNALPHPFILFLIITGILVAAAAILAAIGVEVTNPTSGEVGSEKLTEHRWFIMVYDKHGW